MRQKKCEYTLYAFASGIDVSLIPNIELSREKLDLFLGFRGRKVRV